MKRLIFFLVLLPVLVFGQFVVSGGGSSAGTGTGVTTIADTSANPDPGHIYFFTGDSSYYTWGDGDYWLKISSLTVSQMLPVIRGAIEDSSYTKLDDSDTLTTRGARKLKVPGLLVTGPSKFENDITVRANLTLQSSLVPKVLADSGRYMVGITNDGGLRQKGLSQFGATPTPLYITTNGRIGNTLSPQHMFVAIGNTAALSGFNFVNPNRNKARGDTTASTDSASVFGGIRGGYPTIGVRSNFGLLEWQVQNGWAQVGVKLTVADSFRTNLTSKLIGGAAIGAGTAWYAAQDSLVTTSGGTSNVRVRSMVDTGEYQLPAGAEGFGEVKIGAEYAHFYFESDGVVTLIANTTNVSTTNDTDNKLNIYDGGNNIVIENQLGSTLNCLIRITYMTP